MDIEVRRSGSQPAGKGPADWFTGSVRIDPLFHPDEPSRVSGGSVTFEPGARTAWHAHPLGQTLIVTAGLGGCNARAGRSRKYWHGATPSTAMTHIAIQEALGGSPVTWMEQVSDEQYHK
jgi:quercetin dioxygenase-like cupin family protein